MNEMSSHTACGGGCCCCCCCCCCYRCVTVIIQMFIGGQTYVCAILRFLYMIHGQTFLVKLELQYLVQPPPPLPLASADAAENLYQIEMFKRNQKIWADAPENFKMRVNFQSEKSTSCGDSNCFELKLCCWEFLLTHYYIKEDWGHNFIEPDFI